MLRVLAYLRDEPGASTVGEVIAAWGDDRAAAASEAVTAADLFPRTREFGSSLADRACLAVAICRELPVLTADREWSRASLDLEIRQIR